MTRYSQFPALSDRVNFPILSQSDNHLIGDLVGCDSLAFATFFDRNAVVSAISRPGKKWHEYGDVRWPNPETWIELDMTPLGFNRLTGVLVKRTDIPLGLDDWPTWVAQNGPLYHLFPDTRGPSQVKDLISMLRAVDARESECDGPADLVPRTAQLYVVYYLDGTKTVPECRYLDFLNESGEVIPNYRVMLAGEPGLAFRHATLHALFSLNEEIRHGLGVAMHHQLSSFEPLGLPPDAKPPLWLNYHPFRFIRLSPALRSLSTTGAMSHGHITYEALNKVTEACVHGQNAQMLAFTRLCRPHPSPHEALNKALAAFVHKCCGSAVYSLPDKLTEEFILTDCFEVLLNDIKLPFDNLYLSFSTPEPLFLGNGAKVDGCYVVKQGGDQPDSHPEFLLMLTSSRREMDYENSLPIACDDPVFSIHLPISDSAGDLDVETAIDLGVSEFLERNAPPTDDIGGSHKMSNGYEVTAVDIRAESRARRVSTFLDQEPVFMTCINVIINALFFISYRPDDIIEELDRSPPEWVTLALSDKSNSRSARDRRFNANRHMAQNEYTRIHICGPHLFSEPSQVGLTKGVSPRAHWRRGHWRRQRHGSGLLLITLKWIRPTLVMKDSGQVSDGRIYDFPNEP